MKSIKLILIAVSLVCFALLAGCGPDISAAAPPETEVDEDSSGCGIYDALSRIGDDDAGGDGGDGVIENE
ncbi:MAG: hypothetical protein IJG50_08430 [Clostridia bacterium]|nr:hypothetical protein [Clostridia bacterium]